MFLKKNLTMLGIDGAVAYRVLWRLIQGLSGLVTIWIIAHYFSLDEQGFYFTFASVLSLQVFVELGLSVVIIQFASHEKAFLAWDENKGILIGKQEAKERLASLIKLIAKWYSVASLLIIMLLITAGYIFFAKQQAKYPEVTWHLPWIFLALSFSLFFCFSPFLNVLEGTGKIKEVAKVRVKQDFFANILFWLSCFCGLGLWAAPILYLGKSIAIILWVSTKWRRKFFKDCFRVIAIGKISWLKEIFPFQWKIALSWISGYLIFQLFNPILFAFQGAKVAGQMGLTLAAFNGIISLSMAWIETRVPVFGEFIARKEFRELDKLFANLFWRSLSIIIVLVMALVCAIYLLQHFRFPIGQRFLSVELVSLLAGITIMNHIIFAMASYLRAHKREPLLLCSVVIALLVLLSTYYFGKYYGATSVILGYFMITLVLGLGWVAIIFNKKKQEWHNIVNHSDYNL